MRKIYNMSILLLALAVMWVGCDDEEGSGLLPVGEVTLVVDGNNQIAPATVSFSASAENANTYIWDFGYSKDVDGDGEELSMGAQGQDVTMTFETPGTYTVMLKAYGKDEVTEVTTVSIYAASDLSYTFQELGNTLDEEQDLCNSQVTFDVDLSFDVDVVNGFLVEEYYLTKTWGEQEVIDTLTQEELAVTVDTYTALMQDFEEVPDYLSAGEEVKYYLSAKLLTDEETIIVMDSLIATAELTEVFGGPVLPEGEWLAENLSTSYSTTVYLVQTGANKYWISNFGMDWSNWTDYWYTTEVSIGCTSDVTLDAVGRDNPTDIEIPDGIYPEPRSGVRVMPYRTVSGSPVYDETNQKLIFSNVEVTDEWWAADNHTIDITFTYIK